MSEGNNNFVYNEESKNVECLLTPAEVGIINELLSDVMRNESEHLVATLHEGLNGSVHDARAYVKKREDRLEIIGSLLTRLPIVKKD